MKTLVPSHCKGAIYNKQDGIAFYGNLAENSMDMKRQREQPKTIRIGNLQIPRKPTIILILLLLLVVPFACLYTQFPIFAANYAQEVARPIEEELLKAGAVKKCTRADNGHGIDNQEPHYNAYFETNLTKDEAERIIIRVAGDNGYQLSHQDSPYEFIDWYSDTAKSASKFSELQDGTIGLSLSVYSGGDKLSCDGKRLRQDANHTAILLGVGLPAWK